MTTIRYHFNTGRLYAEHGQRITLLVNTNTGIVYFKDHSRMIDGTVQLSTLGAHYRDNDTRSFLRWFMHRYDYGDCTYYLPYEIDRQLQWPDESNPLHAEADKHLNI